MRVIDFILNPSQIRRSTSGCIKVHFRTFTSNDNGSGHCSNSPLYPPGIVVRLIDARHSPRRHFRKSTIIVHPPRSVKRKKKRMNIVKAWTTKTRGHALKYGAGDNKKQASVRGEPVVGNSDVEALAKHCFVGLCAAKLGPLWGCLLYTSPSPRD